MNRSGLVVLCLVLARQLAFADAAPAASQAEILTRTARRLAIEGKCSSLAVVSERVRELDATYHAAELAADPAIAACKERIDRRSVASDLDQPPPRHRIATSSESPIMLQQTTAPASGPSCTTASVAFEPSMWSNSEQHGFRHMLGVSIRDCGEQPAAISGQLGARLDLGSLGAMAGAEAEVMYAIGGGAKLGLVAGLVSGTAKQATIGLRLRSEYIWAGVELTSTTLRLERDEMDDAGLNGTGVIFGIGLSGEAGKAFGRAEAWLIYAVASGLSR